MAGLGEQEGRLEEEDKEKPSSNSRQTKEPHVTDEAVKGGNTGNKETRPETEFQGTELPDKADSLRNEAGASLGNSKKKMQVLNHALLQTHPHPSLLFFLLIPGNNTLLLLQPSPLPMPQIPPFLSPKEANLLDFEIL